MMWFRRTIQILFMRLTEGFVLTGDNNLKGFRFLNSYMLEPKYAAIKPVKGEICDITSQNLGDQDISIIRGMGYFCGLNYVIILPACCYNANLLFE